MLFQTEKDSLDVIIIFSLKKNLLSKVVKSGIYLPLTHQTVSL